MDITRQEVEKVAKLARLALSEAETTAFSQQLNQIVAYVQKLKTFPTDDVEPTSTVLGQVNVFRPDQAQPSLSQDQALGNAPDAEASCFRVPKIIQESS
ncbi:MAG: gatC [Nitrospira sp.]|nr:gatC [Nitrospira sp.]